MPSNTKNSDNEKNVLMEFSMTPLDKGASVSQYVSRSLDIIDKSGLDYKLNPMGTVVEGDWHEVLDVLTQCYNKMSSDCDRITISVKMDYRKGKQNRLTKKIESIEGHLGRKINQ